jgi:spore maturation protein CgeB
LLHQSKIVLNITRSAFYGLETGVTLRIFEALAARCFLLTDYCDELNDLFVLGEEIETYKSTGELVEKVNYYLDHEEERESIAQKGHERFMKEYTWEARMKEMLRSIT